MSEAPSTGTGTVRRSPLAARCHHHPSRPAAARCPACGGFFCHECVTEHEGRMLCASCLARSPTAARRRRVRPLRALATLSGFGALWGSLYLLGRLLIAVPDETHPSSAPHAGTADVPWFPPEIAP